MTKRITSEDCEGNIEDIEDGRYNSHVVPVAAEDDPGYEEIDYGDCTEFEVPLGRYGSHVVPIGGGGGGGKAGSACPNGGLKEGTDINGDGCLSIDVKPGGAIILDGGKLAIDTTKLKVSTDNVYPSGTNPGIVYTGPDGEVWNTQDDYNQWLYEDQERQDLDRERVEQESKVRDLALELEILYLALHNQACNVVESCRHDPGGPPFIANKSFGISGNVIHITNDIVEESEPKIGHTLRISGDTLSEDWSSVITTVGEKYQPASGYQVYDITVEDAIPSEISGTPKYTFFSIAFCEDGEFVTDTEFTQDQKRQDDEFAKDQERQDDEWTEDQERQDEELADEIQARAIRDLLHDAEIRTLEYKLDALIGVTFRGTYEFKHDQSCEEEYLECMANCTNDARCETDCLRAYSECEENNVDPGFFEAIDPDGRFDHLQEIIISKNDKSNVEIDWASVLSKDDYLEVDHVLTGQLDKTNYGLYRILEEPEAHTNSKGEVVYVMKLQFMQGDGVLNEKELYEIRGITSSEGVNPEELGDFLTKSDAASTYLPLIGGTLTGSLMMDGSASVKTRHLDSGNNSDLQIKRNGSRRILVGTDKITFDKVPAFSGDPSEDSHLTRKKWVSDNFASSSHGHSGYASSSHSHNSTYVKGNYTITKTNGNWYIS